MESTNNNAGAELNQNGKSCGVSTTKLAENPKTALNSTEKENRSVFEDMDTNKHTGPSTTSEPTSNGHKDSQPMENSPAEAEPMSVCLVCGKKAKSVEFILPNRYCSQSCASKSGSSEFAKTGASNSSTASKRKKKRASYLSAYEENFRMDNIEDRKSIRPKKSRVFSWTKFLHDEKLTEAPEALFVNEPPYNYTNPFRVGQKLEGIDPSHPGTFCAMTVAEVKGLRLRLHFDGYSDCYDIWTYANSDTIFPVGWCKETGREVNPPKGVTKDNFSWDKYIQLSKAVVAPKENFMVCSQEFKEKVPGFQVGDKLEACDVKNNMLVCVATVADTYGNKLLVHFDGWEDTYDYWCSYSSPHIHHVGWCQENLQVLSAPNGYQDPVTFTWESYLEQTKSGAAPRDAFQMVFVPEFEPKMALEAVDKRNPTLIRVAEVLRVLDGRVRLHFSGWDNKYDFWEDSDSPDLHPIGWCQRTGHALQPPITPLDIVNHNGPCPTPGCFGYGHVKGAKFSCHQSPYGCPYSDINLSKDNAIHDRLGPKKVDVVDSNLINNTNVIPSTAGKCPTPGCDGTGHVTGRHPTHFTQSGCPLLEANQHKLMKNADPNYSLSPTRKRKSKRSSRGSRAKRSRRSVTTSESTTAPPLYPRNQLPELAPKPVIKARASPTFAKPLPVDNKPAPQAILQTGIHNSVFLPSIPSSQKAEKNLPVCWDRNIKLLPGVSSIKFADVPKWSPAKVASQLKKIIPTLSETQIQLFSKEQIDGEALLLLTQADITSILNLKLGPALKIFNTVRVIRKALGYACP